jgi:hypothetical protein
MCTRLKALIAMSRLIRKNPKISKMTTILARGPVIRLTQKTVVKPVVSNHNRSMNLPAKPMIKKNNKIAVPIIILGNRFILHHSL